MVEAIYSFLRHNLTLLSTLATGQGPWGRKDIYDHERSCLSPPPPISRHYLSQMRFPPHDGDAAAALFANETWGKEKAPPKAQNYSQSKCQRQEMANKKSRLYTPCLTPVCISKEDFILRKKKKKRTNSGIMHKKQEQQGRNRLWEKKVAVLCQTPRRHSSGKGED